MNLSKTLNQISLTLAVVAFIGSSMGFIKVQTLQNELRSQSQTDISFTDEDLDNDGFKSVYAGGHDCNDNNGAINPIAREIPGNKIDENCDGLFADPPQE